MENNNDDVFPKTNKHIIYSCVWCIVYSIYTVNRAVPYLCDMVHG